MLKLVLVLILDFAKYNGSRAARCSRAEFRRCTRFIIRGFRTVAARRLSDFSSVHSLRLSARLVGTKLPISKRSFLAVVDS